MMMKKFIFICLLSALMMILGTKVSANTAYHSFETLELSEGKLLTDFTKDEYKVYYKNVDKRKFAGWRVFEVYDDIKVSYVTETIFSYYNDGYTSIDYAFKLEMKETTKLSLSASGSIGLKSSTESKGFKNNLESSLKLSAEYTKVTDNKSTYEINFEVDPGTQVDLYVYGEGKISNGVAARYLFWIRLDRGGYEVFIITTQYQRLEKKRI
jgi:hypothetical protein